MISFIKNTLVTKDARTAKAYINIVVPGFIKGLSVILSFILIPLTVNFVNPTQYGVWISLSSIVSWFNFLDIGLGHGLRNKLAENNIKGQLQHSKILISTTYAILSIISFFLFIVFLILSKVLKWQDILNVDQISESTLQRLCLTTVGLFCLQFVSQILNNILTAFHKIALISIISLIAQIITTSVIYLLTKTTEGNLLFLILVIAGVPVVVQFFASIIFFYKANRALTPSIKHINFKYSRGLLGIGGSFFLIQIGGLVLFQTDNLLITQLLGPKEVTIFSLSYKLFSVITILFTIVMTPFWSSFTEAYANQEFDWIKVTFKKTMYYWLIASFASTFLLIASPVLIPFWLRTDTIEIPFTVLLPMTFYTIGYCWLMVNCYLLNGIGKIRVQLYLYTVSTIINIPLGIVLGKVWGISGVILSNIIIFIFMGTTLYIQVKKIIDGRAYGVWNK